MPQRQFLLRPDPAINNAVIYCLAEFSSEKANVVRLTEPDDTGIQKG